ncbi:MAG TPA: NAD(P)-binding domain-containing protein [Acidimicrobiia bacterium]
MTAFDTEYVNTVVIGGGQAGLSVGYHLASLGIEFVILDANARIGDAWRSRWDSLRVFTPAKFSGLDGMPFPTHPDYFPTKDEYADYLEEYAHRFGLPVRLGVEVDRLGKRGDKYLVAAGDEVIEADNVVVAMAHYQKPKIPDFASELDPSIYQTHSLHYRNPAQLRPGDALVVGAGNSGVEIALDVNEGRRVWLAGEYPGHIPFDIDGFWARKLLVLFVLRGVFHRLLSVRTPIGRRFRDKKMGHGVPLVRTKPRDIASAGIEQVPRMAGVSHGLPLLVDGRTIEVANVVWCTGFEPSFLWIDIDVLDNNGFPRHRRGVVEESPGLYFVGLEFLYALSSSQFHGVGRDAAYVAHQIASRLDSTAAGSTEPGAAAYEETA